jgi:cell division protein FtsB
MSLGVFFQNLFQRGAKRAGIMLAVAAVIAYGWIALRGPQGIEALFEKRREIRALQEHNAAMARENERRRERIRRLGDSRSEQEMEIRKQLKMIRPGETTFILPDGSKDAPKPAAPPE